MIRIQIVGVLLTMLSFAVSAEGYRSVRVELKDGSKVEVQLSAELRTLFSQKMVSFTGGGTNVQVSRSNIKAFVFQTQDAASIGEVEAGEAPRLADGTLSFSLLPAGSSVTVTDGAGRTVLSRVAEGDFVLSLSQFTPGMYMVTVNGVTYKILTR